MQMQNIAPQPTGHAWQACCLPDHTHLKYPWQVVSTAAAQLTECNHSPRVRTLDAQHAGNGHCAGGGEEPRPAWQQRDMQPGAARRLAPRACSARSVDSCLAWPALPGPLRLRHARIAHTSGHLLRQSRRGARLVPCLCLHCYKSRLNINPAYASTDSRGA
jgi:hypothetical protein